MDFVGYQFNNVRSICWDVGARILNVKSTSLALLFTGLDSRPTPWPENPFTTSLLSRLLIFMLLALDVDSYIILCI
ncbi:hypothetical protein L9F63_015269, partial [Diploptera punctata]